MRRDGKLPVIWIIILIVLPFIAALIALGIGRMSISLGEVLDVLRTRIAGGHVSSQLIEKTVMQLRLPRIVLAALVGAGLSVSGCAFQSLFANPLATPDTLGVASGASFGAALGILLGDGEFLLLVRSILHKIIVKGIRLGLLVVADFFLLLRLDVSHEVCKLLCLILGEHIFGVGWAFVGLTLGFRLGLFKLNLLADIFLLLALELSHLLLMVVLNLRQLPRLRIFFDVNVGLGERSFKLLSLLGELPLFRLVCSLIALTLGLLLLLFVGGGASASLC